MKAIIAACVGGIIGAVVWGLISYTTGYEIGIIAWGIGGLVGLLSAVAGGQGSGNGAICAVVTVVAMIAGKGLAVSLVVDKELKGMLEPMYAAMQEEAKEFVGVETADDQRQFMVDKGYSDAANAAGVSDSELEEFRTTNAPILRDLNDGMSYKQWQNAVISKTEVIKEGIKESIGVIDIIFFLLGVATAFKIGSGLQEA